MERADAQPERTPVGGAAADEIEVTVVDDDPYSQVDAGGQVDPPDGASGETLTRSLIELGIYTGLTATKITGAALGAVRRRLAQTGPMRIANQVAADTVAAVREEVGVDWSQSTRVVEDQLARVIAVVVPVVVESVDPDDLLQRVDLEALLDEIDMNALLSRIDVNRLLAAVDLDQLLSSIDLASIIERVDLNEVLADVDLDALMDRVDVEAIVRRVRVGDRVVEGTSQLAGSALDLARRQAVGLDELLARVVNRVLGRDSDAMPRGPRALAEPQVTEPPSELLA